MRHRRTTVKLGRTASHRNAMLRTMVTDFFRHEKIRTTEAKAKALRPYAEKLITLGKKESLHARRQAARLIRDKLVLRKLFEDLAPRYAERPGGYTRITKLSQRAGDNADMAVIELVEAELKSKTKTAKKKAASGPRTAAQDTAKAAAAVEESVAEPDEVAEDETLAAESESESEPAAAAEDDAVDDTPAEESDDEGSEGE